jgi:hypothetical protein
MRTQTVIQVAFFCPAFSSTLAAENSEAGSHGTLCAVGFGRDESGTTYGMEHMP